MSRGQFGEVFILPPSFTHTHHGARADRRGPRARIYSTATAGAPSESVLVQHLATVHAAGGRVVRVGLAPDGPAVDVGRVAAFAASLAASLAARSGYEGVWRRCRAKGHPSGCRVFGICQRVADGLDAELAALTAAVSAPQGGTRPVSTVSGVARGGQSVPTPLGVGL